MDPQDLRAPSTPPDAPPARPTAWDRSGVKPIRIFQPSDPEVQNQIGPWDRISGGVGIERRIAGAMTAADEKRFDSEMKAEDVRRQSLRGTTHDETVKGPEGTWRRKSIFQPGMGGEPTTTDLGEAPDPELGFGGRTAEGSLIHMISNPRTDPATKAWAQGQLDQSRRFNQPEQRPVPDQPVYTKTGELDYWENPVTHKRTPGAGGRGRGAPKPEAEPSDMLDKSEIDFAKAAALKDLQNATTDEQRAAARDAFAKASAGVRVRRDTRRNTATGSSGIGGLREQDDTAPAPVGPAAVAPAAGAPARGAAPNNPAPEGHVVVMPDGSKRVKKNGQWVPLTR
jgi:hypothetical protein